MDTVRSDVDLALILREGDYDPLELLRPQLWLAVELGRAGIPEPDVCVINEAPLLLRVRWSPFWMLIESRL